MSEFAVLPPSVRKLLAAHIEPLPNLEAAPGVPRIKLNEVIGRMGYFYEKIRNSIDFRDEHLLRRYAIERILRRRYLVESRTIIDARLLINELIRGRYLPNDKLPATIVAVVQNYIDRYVALMDHLQLSRTSPENRRTIAWILSVASADVEEHLSPSTREDALVEVMYGTLRNNLILPENIPAGQEQDILVYLAIHRALVKSDDAILRYHLFRWAYPQWRNPNHAITEEIREHFPALMAQIEERIQHPLTERLLSIARRYAVPFLALADVLHEHNGDIRGLIANSALMDEAVEKAMEVRMKKAKTRLRRTTVRSVVYIFITKMMLALAIELPYEVFVLKLNHYAPVLVNSIFHPVLMVFIGISAAVPGKENTARVVEAVKEILNPQHPRQVFGKKLKPRPRTVARSFFFNLFYLATFVAVFGGIVWGLHILQFNWLSIVIFLFFLSVISFFGMRVRNVIRELSVMDRRENIFLLLLSFVSTPILRVGQWFSKKVPKVNLFIFLLDFIIEAPFKIFVEVVEEWFSFLKEKREEIS
ncbi:MAG: hypothetical protein AAB445_02915 [Patescibacteria group bacterium]